ncbi:MAG: hypothetical protein K0S46_1919 [Moraxellaceae bacterium]|jgi:cytochrome b561|nr:hypothetical protein [Moraxellaceae bacterium]
MSLRNTSTRWGPVARFLHWLFLFLLIGAWYAVEMHEDFPKGSPERREWMQLHFAIGISVFVLLWVRLGWRLSGDVPAPLPGPRWQQLTSALVHAALYLILIVMPLTGLLTTQLAGRAVSWFGLIDIPLFLQKNSELAEQMEELHGEVLWPVLLALVGLHAVAALWHHFVLKDDTLKRMLPFRRS